MSSRQSARLMSRCSSAAVPPARCNPSPSSLVPGNPCPADASPTTASSTCGITRCGWLGADVDPVDITPMQQLMMDYHDQEWSPADLKRCSNSYLFEMLTLEGAQAGLSWSTVLGRRLGYQQAYLDWDVAAISHFTPDKIAEMRLDVGIIRNQAKIVSSVQNAKLFLKLCAEQPDGLFVSYLRRFDQGDLVFNLDRRANDAYVAMSPLSTAISTDLRQRGFKFVGPTIMYAFLQAIGFVHDHDWKCFRHRRHSKLMKR